LTDTTIIPNLKDWYWKVGTDIRKVFSSARGIYVPTEDEIYIAWLDAGHIPTLIDNNDSLGVVMKDIRQRPVDANVLAAYQGAVSSIPDIVNFPVLLDLHNRVRVLEGHAPQTGDEYRDYIASIV
jgi:hypothetical protein